MPDQTAELSPFAFVLAVPDLEQSTSYFRDALGFSIQWPEAPDWRLASRGSVRIMIGYCPDEMPASSTGDHSYFGYLHVDDVDALHQEFIDRGAIILQAPADQPYGMRAFLVGTPDGHRMMIGQPISGAV